MDSGETDTTNLKGTKNYTLTLGNDTKEVVLEGSSNLNWAGNTDDRKSTGGYIFHMNNRAISWQAKKQATIAMLTLQVEYMALLNAIKEAIWIQLLLKEMGFEQAKATTIKEDNQPAIALARNPVHHTKAKQIDITYYFIRETITNNMIKLKYTESKYTMVDILTKYVAKGAFEKHWKHMGIMVLKVVKQDK